MIILTTLLHTTGNVRTHASRLHVPAEHVPWADLPIQHVPRGGIVFFLWKGGVDWRQDDCRYTQRMADNMGYQSAFRRSF